MERLTEEATTDAPFSMGLRSGDFVFVSGQGPLDDTGEVVGDTIEAQTDRTLENVADVLAAADLALDDVVKVGAYITDPDHFDRFNEAYVPHFSDPKPTRTCVVTDLVLDGMLVEIDAIAEA